MDIQKFNDLIYAYSAGCLDQEELAEINEYLISGGKIPNTELGELQNIVSFLPTILELENPEPQVKDRVARRLYRLRDEIRAKVRPEIKEENSGQTPKNEKIFNIKPLAKSKPEFEEDNFTEKFPGKIDKMGNYQPLLPYLEEEEQFAHDKFEAQNFEEQLVGDNQFENNQLDVEQKEQDLTFKPEETQLPPFEIPRHEEPKFKYTTPMRDITSKEEIDNEEEEKEKKFGTLLFNIFILFITLLLTGGIYYFFSNEIQKDRKQISDLSGQVNALTDELGRLNKNQKILSILGSKDARTTNLDGTVYNPKGFGKLTVVQDGKDGVLQLYNMPALKGSQVYQLWLVSKLSYFSLGTIKTKKDVEYMQINPFPEVAPQNIDKFILTLEDNENMTTPSANIYLSTSQPKLVR